MPSEPGSDPRPDGEQERLAALVDTDPARAVDEVSRLLGEILGEEAATAPRSPEEVPDRYDLASPIERLPLGVPSLCIHARDDAIVPLNQSESFVAAAQQAGDEAELHVADGDHFVVIDPESAAWQPVLTWLERFES